MRDPGPGSRAGWKVPCNADITSDELYAHVSKWYAADAGRSTIQELLVILGRTAAEGK